MRLSNNFTLKELTRTDTGLPNVPTAEEQWKLFMLAQYILQPVRDKWGRIDIGSGFRSTNVNERVGGSSYSQHLLAEAADITPADADIDVVFAWLRNHMKFGQAILEKFNGHKHIHISMPRMQPFDSKIDLMNGNMLTFNGKIYEIIYEGFKL